MLEQRDALLKLLRDDDPATLGLVKGELARAGAGALEELRVLLAEADAVPARHVRDVIAEIEERESDTIFAQLCADFTDASDLEDAAWRLAATFMPGDDFQLEREQVETWGTELARRLKKAPTPLDAAETLAEFLADDVGLRGNEDDYYDLDNSLLPMVIGTHLGIPISLSLIYLMVGRRAGMDIEGVALPGHFLVRCGEIFLDPFHRGRRVGLQECRALLQSQGIELRPEHLAPATPRQMLRRMLSNLHHVAADMDQDLAMKIAGWIESMGELE